MLATGAPTPPVAAFTTGRAVALARCTPSASTTPIAIGIHCCEEKNASGSVTATVVASMPELNASPPAVGRTTVCTRSFTESNPGILSATNSSTSSTTRMSRTHSFESQAQAGGSSTRPVNRSSAPSTTSGIQALSPAASARPVPVSTSSTRTSHAVASSVARIEWSACI